jgi:hypothetical protein
MKTTTHLLIPVLLLAALAVVPLTRPAQAETPVQYVDDGNVNLGEDGPVSFLSASDAADYWTPERMAAAVPAPGLEPTTDVVPSQGQEVTLLADGPAQAVGGNGIGGVSGTLANSLIPGYNAAIPTYTYPFAYTTSYGDIFAPTPYAPYSTFGKLYYTQLGTDYVCSGNSVSSGQGNKALVLTAAHCLHAGNNLQSGKSTNIEFVPSVSNLNTPFGSWTAVTSYVKASFFANGNPREDFGLVVTDHNSNGCGYLGDCVGTEGLAWNQPVNQEFWAYAYPVAAPYSGLRLVLCSGSTAMLDTAMSGTGAPPMAMGCRFTEGSSGGGWVIQGRTAGLGYINSVVSYKYIAQAWAIYGPYFGSSFGSLWAEARDDVVP